jgi:DNA-binding Lrp family transcriptional regulator
MNHTTSPAADASRLDEQDRRLIAAIQGGLPLVSRPYAAVAEQVGMSEEQVIERIARLKEEGAIKRMGIVVRHHELGYIANAMVVWDIPDQYTAELGVKLGNMDCVTLCYERPRRPPLWPYNLFSMIHARSRQAVLDSVEQIVRDLGLEEVPHQVLFSGRRFKQRGARYQ